MLDGISIEQIRWEETEEWLALRASADDLRPFARAWLVHQRKAELVKLGLEPEERRVEALRAASRIGAGVASSAGGGELNTLGLAEAYARWLETGER